jgi:protein-disulfide isomerase
MMMTVLILLAAAQAALASPPPIPPIAPVRPAAPVEVVVYSDFQCPYCRLFSQTFRELQTKGVDGGRTTFVFRNFPLGIHPKARLAHQAAVAAAEQGKFWEMHDLLFANQQRADRDDLIGYARQLHLDMPRFLSDFDSERTRRAIEADVAEGTRRKVSATPTFYVNGQQFVGNVPLAQLTRLLEGEHGRARAVAEVSDARLSKGPAGAPITIELYADLQSPVTRPATVVIDEVMKRFPEAVRLQFRNFPLAFHPQAALAHEAAMTAARDGRFWEFASYLLDHQDAVREQDLVALAGRLQLDTAAFAQALQEHRYAPRVDADLRAGLNRGLRGSPVIFVDGRRIDGVPTVQTLTESVEAALSSHAVNPNR